MGSNKLDLCPPDRAGAVEFKIYSFKFTHLKEQSLGREHWMQKGKQKQNLMDLQGKRIAQR